MENVTIERIWGVKENIWNVDQSKAIEGIRYHIISPITNETQVNYSGLLVGIPLNEEFRRITTPGAMAVLSTILPPCVSQENFPDEVLTNERNPEIELNIEKKMRAICVTALKKAIIGSPSYGFHRINEVAHSKLNVVCIQNVEGFVTGVDGQQRIVTTKGLIFTAALDNLLQIQPQVKHLVLEKYKNFWPWLPVAK